MTSIEIHGDVCQVKLLYRIGHESFVSALCICAFGNVEIRHQVGQTIRLNGQLELHAGICVDLSNNGVDVVLVESGTVVGN